MNTRLCRTGPGASRVASIGSRIGARIGAAMLLATAPALGRAQAATPSDSALRRAQRMVSEGVAVAGRAVVDSVLAASPTASPRYAEALFWRAALAESAAKAEQDYVRLTTQHALSPWAGEALLRLGQLQYARGERSLALSYFARLVVEHSETPLAAPGLFWKARVLLEQNDAAPACEALREAKGRALATAIELRNQIDYYAQRCVVNASAIESPPPTMASGGAAPAGAATGSVTPPPATAVPSPRTTPATAKGPDAGWSVQLAAFKTKTEATKMVRTLAQRGYDARVDGDAAPFRVRVGRYATRAAATAASGRMKKQGLKGGVVHQGPE